MVDLCTAKHIKCFAHQTNTFNARKHFKVHHPSIFLAMKCATIEHLKLVNTLQALLLAVAPSKMTQASLDTLFSKQAFKEGI